MWICAGDCRRQTGAHRSLRIETFKTRHQTDPFRHNQIETSHLYSRPARPGDGALLIYVRDLEIRPRSCRHFCHPRHIRNRAYVKVRRDRLVAAWGAKSCDPRHLRRVGMRLTAPSLGFATQSGFSSELPCGRHVGRILTVLRALAYPCAGRHVI